MRESARSMFGEEPGHGFMTRLRCLATIGLLASLLAPIGPSRAQDDARDLKARKHFTAGEYAAALDLYAALYAETLHPTYLRNVGRCHQKLGNADRAIDSFREYLRKAKDHSAEQRAEVEGFIREMEELKRKNEAWLSG
jgi:tetratricopeptide (TPR) repeat protein